MDQRKRSRGRLADPTGSALLIAIMVMVVVTLLGITYLFQADTENLIARNERDRAQTLGVAEAGARMIKSWFDRPIRDDITTPSHLFLNTHDLRKKRLYDVSQRLINDDGDPGTPPLSSGDAGWLYYMEGFMAPGSPASDGDPDHALRFFQKPYRGGIVNTLLGTEDGPDIVIAEDSSSADVRAFLASINAAVFTDTSKTGRITRIELYEPPYVNIAGQWERFGIGTVKVTAAKFRPASGGTEEKIAERVVKVVLNEAPYPGPGGPLQSCQGIEATGSFQAHWGKVTAFAEFEVKPEKWDSAIPRINPSEWAYLGLPWDDPATDSYMKDMGGGSGTDIEDPWMVMRTLAQFSDAPSPYENGGNATQPWGFPYTPGTGYTNPSPDKEHSNLIQGDTSVTCPDMPYELWKSVAKDGGKNIHYLTWVADDRFQEGASVKTFQEWTNGETGLFFFDSVNNSEPDGTNLTPAIAVNGTWYTEGFIYLNVKNFRTTGMSGQDLAMIAPGEPFNDIFTGGPGYTGVYNAEPFTDVNGNGYWDPDPILGDEPFTDTIPPANGGTNGVYDAEPWVNIDYDTSLGGGGDPPTMTVKQDPGIETFSFTFGGRTTTRTTTNARDADGLPVDIEANLFGVLYNSGAFSAQGNGVYYGSVVAAGGVGEDYFGAPAAGNPELYFDERLVKGEWPPPELELPLTIITAWKTDF